MFKATLNDRREFEIKEKSQHLFEIDGSDFPLTLLSDENGNLLARNGSKQYNVGVVSADHQNKSYILKINNKKHHIQLKNRLDILLDTMGFDQTTKSGEDRIGAPMPGLILEINCEEGKSIKKGDPLIVLEAMKMENIIKAPVDGVINQIKVKPGDSVEKNQILIQL